MTNFAARSTRWKNFALSKIGEEYESLIFDVAEFYMNGWKCSLGKIKLQLAVESL